jgi:hypothetical protein
MDFLNQEVNLLYLIFIGIGGITGMLIYLQREIKDKSEEEKPLF